MKQLPEKIALDKAVHGQKLYQGSVELRQMKRLVDLLDNVDGLIEFSIQFERAARILGKAQIVVKAELALICTISQKRFMYPVEIDSTVGFIDDLAFEDMLGVDLEASWAVDGCVKPLELIEDELILAVPDSPFDESCSSDESEEEMVVTEEKLNPFDVLKDLKK